MDERKLRKYEHALVISGSGIILFGAWSIVKAAIFFIVTPLKDFARVFPEDQRFAFNAAGLSDNILGSVVLVIVLLILIASLAIRYYVGRAAIQDGRHIRKRRATYIIVAVILAINLVYSTLWNYFGNTTEESDWLDSLNTASVSVFVDLTSLLCLVEMIISAILVRKLRRRLPESSDGREVV